MHRSFVGRHSQSEDLHFLGMTEAATSEDAYIEGSVLSLWGISLGWCELLRRPCGA